MFYHENINDVSILKRMPPMMGKAWDSVEEHLNLDTDELLIQQVLQHYSSTLQSSPRAIPYLSFRKLYNREAIKHFSIGFADRSLGLRLKKLDAVQEELTRGSLQRIGLLKPSGHEFFRGAIIFPFLDEDGKIVGGYGRRITSKLRANSVYHVHWVDEETTFFNLAALEKFKSLILCKTPIEALTFWCLGFKNVIALMGMYSFRVKHLEKLKQHGIEEVLIAFDNNYKGNKMAVSIQEALQWENIQSYSIKLPKGKDVNQTVVESSEPKLLLRELIIKAKHRLKQRRYS